MCRPRRRQPVLHPQPAHGLAESYLRAMASSSVDQRLGHRDRVDRPIAWPPDRFAQDRPQVRLQASDLVGVGEPLVGSELGRSSDSASSPQASDPLQRTRTPGTSRSSRAQSSSAVRRSGVLPSIAAPALGPRTQAKESPVTPDAGSDRSMSNTAAPAPAAWYATEAPTMPAPTTTTSVPGEPRTRDRIPDANGNRPGRLPRRRGRSDQAAARVNVTCVTPLGEEVASTA